MREEFKQPVEADPAEARVRELRDAIAGTVAQLQDNRLIRLEDVGGTVRAALSGVIPGDLGAEEAGIRFQLAAFFERIAGLLAVHDGLVPTIDHGLPGDARFLADMGRFITRRYGLGD
jgi:hypothetical protein